MNDGGPAFPVHIQSLDDLSGQGRDEDMEVVSQCQHPGMSLRDWFAGMALQGILSANYNVDQTVAREAYASADAMIAERAKRK